MTKGWEVKPFILDVYEKKVNAISSRSPSQDPYKIFSFNTKEILTDFQMTLPVPDCSKWVTFANKGVNDLTNGVVYTKGPFKVYGEIPKLIAKDYEFLLKIAFEPEEGGTYPGEIIFDFDGELRFVFPVHGIWEPVPIFYDGSIRYSGQFMHPYYNSLVEDLPKED